jgi:hypothetical protein
MFASLSFSFPSHLNFVTSVFLCDVPNRPRYVVRSQFINNSVLANTEDTKFRAVSNNWSVFAFAHDLGTVSTTSTVPAIHTVGHVRDPAIQYIVANDVYQPQSIYFWNAYSSVADLVRP